MENKIREYERKIEKLEKKVSDLEQYNARLRECLLKNAQFSNKLSNITYEMDCLLVKKGNEIRDLEKKLEESSMRLSRTESGDMLADFDIEITDYTSAKHAVSTTEEFNVNDYVKTLAKRTMSAKKQPDGYFKCSECNHKTGDLSNYEAHFRTQHTDEKPFQCKLCEKTFNRKQACINHIRGHDDRFKLKCTVCDAKFVCSQALMKHGVNKHNGEGYTRKKRIFGTRKRKLDE